MKRSADHTNSAKQPKASMTGGKKGATQACVPTALPAPESSRQADRLKRALLPELLAPCGSLEAFFAAMESGADAIYAGLREFSARARAKNFTLGQMERMLAYAHNHDRRIYITINTLIKEQELPQLVETLAELARLRVDGLIVQDMAVARLVRRHFPSIPLHASTQMTIHNLPGVLMLEEMGFERVVLARELQISDITAIAAATKTELEVFVHGALCFSISGQCHFSSLIGGHSGNRGRCAQPCRRLYSHRNKEGYYFSPNDLSAIELVPELAAAGVKSLKIEGRMKSADYVAKVVSAYRLLLDSPANRLKESMGLAKELLKGSFGRTPTKGFITSSNPADIVNPWMRGGTGRYIGEVKRISGGRIIFENRDHLQVGDRLRLQPKSDMAGQAWTVREIFSARKKMMKSPAGAQVEVVCPFDAKPGDALFMVAAHDSFSLSEEAANRRLQSVGPDRIALELDLSASTASDGAWNLSVKAMIGAANFEYNFPLGALELAKGKDMEGVLKARFDETGDTPFRLARLSAPDFPQIFIPPARLKDIRRQLYRHLGQEAQGEQRAKISLARKEALADAMLCHSATSQAGGGPEELLIAIDSPAEARWALSRGDAAIIPLHRATAHSLPRFLGRLRESAERIIWQLPFIIFENDIPFFMELTRYLHENGFRSFEVNNHSHLPILRAIPDLRISSGYRMFSLNSQALISWHELGIERSTLYIEDDRENLAELLSASLPIKRTVAIYAPVQVMTTRIRMKEVKTGASIESDRGEGYHLRGRDGLSIISAATPFSLGGHVGELRRCGCRSFLLDLSETAPEKRDFIVDAFRADRAIPGTSCFNYERGLA